jgi:hypothetical protein
MKVVSMRARLERPRRTLQKTLEVFRARSSDDGMQAHARGSPASRRGRSVREVPDRGKKREKAAHHGALDPAAAPVNDPQFEHSPFAAGPNVFFDHRGNVARRESVKIQLSGEGKDDRGLVLGTFVARRAHTAEGPRRRLADAVA